MRHGSSITRRARARDRLVGQGEGNGNSAVDAFPAQRAWLYVAIVAVGYMVSRGLAKSGTRDSYWADRSDLLETDDGADAPLARGRGA